MRLKTQDEVAVMPCEAKSPADVLKIDRVANVGHALIRTTDGRMYAVDDGGQISRQPRMYIVPATDEHRAAMRRRYLGG